MLGVQGVCATAAEDGPTVAESANSFFLRSGFSVNPDRSGKRPVFQKSSPPIFNSPVAGF
jgi:hypothetical protein